ncbi:hypothetical protein ACFIJ5_08015 [Haloimpatiens sp. FM7330]|uniref:hypothetical protein n=1 Tax=Haloimpatiens sp. FM7330 TaxID=3298610 RepID=UPI00362A0FC0
MFKSLKTKIIIPMISLLVLIFLVGCSGGSYKTKSSDESNTNNSMKMSYSDFEGYKFTSIKLKKGDELNLNINVTTEEGNLKITFVDENDNELFKVENPKEQINKTIEINKDATYKIKVGGKHKGSYNITWDIKKS